jgi:hypothetical protein
VIVTELARLAYDVGAEILTLALGVTIGKDVQQATERFGRYLDTEG